MEQAKERTTKGRFYPMLMKTYQDYYYLRIIFDSITIKYKESLIFYVYYQGENNFLYKESKRAKLEREKEERRRREEARIEFSAEELALATVPGADFDPTLRQFSLDELRPQPIIRKRKKVCY